MIRVLVDSSADLPSIVASSDGIDVVPVQVRFGSHLVADSEAGRVEFWQRLSAPGPMPEIVAPSTGAFAASMAAMADEEAPGVVVVTPSRRVSASHEAAVMAAEAVRRRLPVRVVESRAVSYAYGLVARAGAAAAAAGADVDETARCAAAAVGRSATLIVVDNVELLRRSRRMGRCQSWLADLLCLKPVLEVTDGALIASGAVRGRQRGRDLMVRRAGVHRNAEQLAVVHAAARDIDTLADRVRSVADRVVVTAELGPLIACHTGPGAVGLVHGS